jgi:hypothetical protein
LCTFNEFMMLNVIVSIVTRIISIYYFSVPLTPADPQWVGAWWISPLIALIGFFVVILPLYGYPRRLPSKLLFFLSARNHVHLVCLVNNDTNIVKYFHV